MNSKLRKKNRSFSAVIYIQLSRFVHLNARSSFWYLLYLPTAFRNDNLNVFNTNALVFPAVINFKSKAVAKLQSFAV